MKTDILQLMLEWPADGDERSYLYLARVAPEPKLLPRLAVQNVARGRFVAPRSSDRSDNPKDVSDTLRARCLASQVPRALA